MEDKAPTSRSADGLMLDFWETVRDFAIGTRLDPKAKPCELLPGKPRPEDMSRHREEPQQHEGDAKGVLDTLDRLQSVFAKSSVLGRRVSSERSDEVRRVLVDAYHLEKTIRRPQQILRALSLVAAFVALGAVPYGLLRTYGWNDQDLAQASNMAQFLEAVASAIFLFSSAFIAVVLLDLRIRTRRASAEIHRCRVIVQLIDSHVLSNEMIIKRLRGQFDPADAGCDHDGVIDYLIYASCLARIAAKTAALYVQWLPRESIVREADLLFQVSMDVERNCLAKVDMMRNIGQFGCVPCTTVVPGSQ